MASHYKTMLDAIEAVLEGRITSDVESYQIAGRQIAKIPIIELKNLHAYYLGKVNQEEDQERVATGKTSKRTIRVKF